MTHIFLNITNPSYNSVFTKDPQAVTETRMSSGLWAKWVSLLEEFVQRSARRSAWYSSTDSAEL